MDSPSNPTALWKDLFPKILDYAKQWMSKEEIKLSYSILSQRPLDKWPGWDLFGSITHEHDLIANFLIYTDDILSIKMLSLLLLLTPDHKMKASSDLLVTFIPVSI